MSERGEQIQQIIKRMTAGSIIGRSSTPVPGGTKHTHLVLLPDGTQDTVSWISPKGWI